MNAQEWFDKLLKEAEDKAFQKKIADEKAKDDFLNWLKEVSE